MITPTNLFKYRKFDKSSIELLVNRELWFANPSSLNDPFEGESSFSEVLQAVWEHYIKLERAFHTSSIVI